MHTSACTLVRVDACKTRDKKKMKVNKGKVSKIGRKWRASRREERDKIERNTDNSENGRAAFPPY